MGAIGRIFARPVTAEEAAERIVAAHLDPHDIWADVKRIGDHEAPPAIACCEMAFVRMAIVGHLCLRLRPDGEGAAMCAAADRMAQRMFDAPGDPDTDAFYGRPLRDVVSDQVGKYRAEAAIPVRIAATLIERIGGDRRSTLACADLLIRFGNGAAADLARVRVRFGRTTRIPVFTGR